MSGHLIYDRLYGHLEIEDSIWRLLQTPEMARLRQLSLSAVPPLALPVSICASKFEHSVGAAHLARLTNRTNPNLRDMHQAIFIATLAHDMGTPPFSHVSEYYQKVICQKDHEQFAEEILHHSSFANEVTKLGEDIDVINKMIQGQYPPYSEIINSTIDLDNLDNTLRFGISTGILTQAAYSAEELAQSFVFQDDQFFLKPEATPHLQGWEKTRKLVYDFVNSSMNLAPASMLLDALEFAFQAGELNKEYFLKTDGAAVIYLSENCNPVTRQLMSDLQNWLFYQEAFSLVSENISIKLQEFIQSFENRAQLAHHLSHELVLPQECISVCLLKNKGFKQIHFPFLGQPNSHFQHQQQQPDWIIKVFIHPEHQDHIPTVQALMSEFLSSFK